MPELTQQMFDATNMLGAADPRHGRMALPEQAKTMFQDGAPMIVVAAGVGADALALLGKRDVDQVVLPTRNIRSTPWARARP